MAVPILVDDREPKYLADRLAQLGLAVGVSRLKFGDYAFWPHGLSVGIERKTISDLLGSMSDKRIVAQAHGMVEGYDLAILLREGSFRRSTRQTVQYFDVRHPEADKEGWVQTGWAWSSFSGMMFDLWLLGLIVWDCPVVGEAALDIATIVESLSKDEHRWIRERTRPDVMTADKQWRNNVWALCAFDGIGPETASDLLRGRTFAEVVSAASVDPTSLMVIRGFGKVRARHLGEEVNRRYG